MAISKYLKDDLRYILFTDIYHRVSTGKGKKTAHKIIEYTIDYIAKNNFKNVNLKHIATETNVSVSQINYYFGTQSQLKLFAIKYTRYLYQDYVIQQMLKGQSFTKMFENYFDSCLNWPKHYPK
jgi:AcrR family transcriptional regulator